MTWRAQSGGQTNKEQGFTRRHRPDYVLVALMGVLLLLGYVVLYAISYAQVEAINEAGNSLTQAGFMARQAAYLGVGVAAFVIASIISITIWQQHATIILVAALIACLLLAIFGITETWPALCASGACRWFDVGFGTFQPAEFLKFGLLLFVSVFLGRRMQKGTVNDVKETVIPLAVIVGLSLLFVVVFQRDLGSGVALLGIVASMVFVAGVNRKIGLSALAAMIAFGGLMVLAAPHRIERVTTFLGGAETQDAGYHIEQAQTAIGSGGMFGVGLGKGTSAFGYVPEAVNDSIFAIMGELFGFVGLLVVLALFVMLLFRLLTIMEHVQEPTMRLLVAGVFGWIATHTLVNIGAMLGVLPLTGLTLPLLSFGGTSLLFIMIALGLVFQISRYTQHEARSQQKEGNKDEGTYSRRRVGRTRHSGSGRHS